MALSRFSSLVRRVRLRPARRVAVAAAVVGGAVVGLTPLAAADGPTEFSNTAAITITSPDNPPPPTPATPYPSTVTVSGMNGPVSDIDVRLNGFSHPFANDVDVMVVGPTGANVVLLSDAGGPDGLVTASNATVTFDDSAAAAVPQSGVITGTVSYRPTDTDAGEPQADAFPAPAPTPGAATTLGGAFTGTNPNGAWSLYVIDDATGDVGLIAGGWTVIVTTSVVAAATTTDLASAPNPSTTGAAVTFTATVTSGGSPVTTGTVTFTEGTTTLAANVPLTASGQASFSTSTLAEGSHTITATYNGTATLLTSSDTVTQVVDNPTTHPDGDTWCNTGSIAVPSSGAATPYPSRITVSGAGSTIGLLTVDLVDVAQTAPFDLEVLLVGPAGQNLILMSDAGGSTPASGVDLTFADAAAGPIPAAGPLVSGTFDPSDHDTDGADAALPPPAPAASGATALATFNGTNPNGTWSLFVADDASGDSGSIAGGWCLNVTTPVATTTALTSSPNPSILGQPVTFTATVTSAGNPVTTGTVDFTEGATVLADDVALNAAGQATFTTSTLTAGSHTITATYSGTPAFEPSSATVTQVVTSDTISPTVALSSAAPDPTNTAPIPVTATFSEAVTGFTATDLAVTNATVGGFSGSGTTYTFELTPLAEGAVTVTVPAGVATDAAGNPNQASATLSRVYDVTGPTVTINQALGQPDPTNASPILFAVEFSEAVTGFATGDVTLSGTAGATTATVTGSGTSYTVAVSGMTAEGTVIASIAAGVATDVAGNPNAASVSTDNTVTYDTTGPTVVLATTATNPTNTAPIPVTATFSEAVSGFDAGDVTVTGATVGGFSGSGTTYTFELTPTVQGDITVTIAAGVATDAAGNPNQAAAPLTVIFDSVAPTVTINQAAGQEDPTESVPIRFTVVFSEPVSGFASADVVISGTAGATTATVIGGPITYEVTVTDVPDAGTVVASVPAGVAADAAGNPNDASTSTDNTVTVNAPPPPPPPPGIDTSSLSPLAPARLLDTRPSSGPLGYDGPKPGPDTTINLQVTGRGGVPADGVSAVVLSVTATEASGEGYVTVWPTGVPRPRASSLNIGPASFLAVPAEGQSIANLVTVPVGTGGQVSLYTQSGTHLVADVAGYYSEAASAAGGRLVATDPARVLDTRPNAPVGYSGPKPGAGQIVTVAVAGHGGVPATGASAVVLNLAATEADGPGYVTAYPGGTARAGTSNLNLVARDQTIAVQVVVPLGVDGTVSFYTYAGTHLVADVNGWFTDATAPVGTSGLFVPVVPERHLDTRDGGGPRVPAGGAVTVASASSVIPATGVAAVAANVTATETVEPGFVTAYPSGIGLPWASNLNIDSPNQTIPNHATVRLGAAAAFDLYTYAPSHLVADVTGWYLA